MQILRIAFGLARLKLARMLPTFVMHVVAGVAVPLVLLGVVVNRSDAASPRLLLGAVLFSAAIIVMRLPAYYLVADRVQGERNLVATTAVTRWLYLVATGIEAVALCSLPLFVLVAGWLWLDVAEPVSAAWLVPLALTLLAFHGLGLCAAAFARGLPSIVMTIDLLTASVVALCPVFYALERVPPLIRPAVEVLAPTLGIEATVAAWQIGALPASLCGPLAAWCAITLGVAYWRFPWGATAA